MSLDDALVAFAAHERVLVALDFDGTLAELVDLPSQARPRAESSQAVAALAATPGTTVALVSGRSRSDLGAVAAPPSGVLLVGSHGAEADGDAALSPEQADLLGRVREELERISAGHEGTHVEVKPAAAVLHTRLAGRRDARAATSQANEGPGAWAGVHAMAGKEVVELSVLHVGKGVAVQQVARETGADAVLYAGDDVTDEDAFATFAEAPGALTIKVGPGETVAVHRVRDPADLARVLDRLAVLRAR